MAASTSEANSVSQFESFVAILRALPDAALLVSGDGRVLVANDQARDALALPNDQGTVAFADLTQERVLTGEFLRMCARSSDPLPGAFAIQRRSSAPVAYVCKGALIRHRTAESPSAVLIRFWQKDADSNAFILLNQKLAELTHEMGRRRQAEEALRRSESALRERAIEAENLNRAKDEFLATLSHELRTPLNAILGWARMLREGNLTEERRARALETIERNARAQAQLIEELLDISAIITGKIRLNVQQVDPIHVIESAIDAIRPPAEAKGVRLQPVLDPQAGPIMGDPDRLQQVWWNLLSNAVKFTPKGGRIQIVLERINSSIEVTIADTGKGIRAEFLPLVFDRFRQQESGAARAAGGLGLGLSIVKSLVELHGGSVRVHSPGENEGATFVVRLPRSLVRTEVAPRADPVVASRGADAIQCPRELDGLRIVVVDDEADNLELLVAILELCGAKVKAAHSAGEGLEAVQSVRPDLLISDIGMPGENGYVLIRKVRNLPPSAGGRTPAIALTAFARAEDRTQALKAGFQAHVPKPVEVPELLAVIASLMGRLASDT